MMVWLSALLVVLSTMTANVVADKWVMTVETSHNWMAGYVGNVTVCFKYRPPPPPSSPVSGEDETGNNETTVALTSTGVLVTREECMSLPGRRFVRGKTYMFEVELYEMVDNLEQVKIFGKPSATTTCKRKGNQDTWHVDSLSFHDMATGRLYRVHRRSVIETRCSAANELLFDKFNVSIQPRPCPMDGVIYKSGEQFNDGCSGRCECRDYSISCVSMCPPSMAIGCRQIYVPGQCCQQHVCENRAYYGTKTCPTYEEGDCEMVNRTVDAGEYPWTVFIKLCDNKECKKFCSGALISERWVITAGDCVRSVSNLTNIRIIVGENTIALREDSDVEMAVENVTFSNAKVQSEQLALLKLRDAVAFDETVQPVTLPKSREQCQGLTRPKCAVSMTGWVNVDADSQQYELYQLSVNLLDWPECDTSSSSSSNATVGYRKRKPLPPSYNRGLCVDLSNDEQSANSECDSCQPTAINNVTDGCPSDKNWYLCTGERGRVILSKLPVATPFDEFLEVNYLVGVVAYQLAPGDTPLAVCKKPAYKLAVSVCNDIDWIYDVTRYDYYA